MEKAQNLLEVSRWRTYAPTVVDANAGGGALCCRGGALCCRGGALCFKWWGHYASSGGYECGRWGIMLQRRGIMLQVVDMNAGGGALCCRGGALSFKWWMRTREMGHYASEVGFECCRIKIEQIQDLGEIRMHSCTMFLG